MTRLFMKSRFPFKCQCGDRVERFDYCLYIPGKKALCLCCGEALERGEARETFNETLQLVAA
jgi:hypothetical protein